MEVNVLSNLIVHADPSVILEKVPRVNTDLARYIAEHIKGDNKRVMIYTKWIQELHEYHVKTVLEACKQGKYVSQLIMHFSLNRMDGELMMQILDAILHSKNYTTSVLYNFLMLHPQLTYDESIIEYCIEHRIIGLHMICERIEMSREQKIAAISKIKYYGLPHPDYYASIAKLDPLKALMELMCVFKIDPLANERKDGYIKAFACVAEGISWEKDTHVFHEYINLCLALDAIDNIVECIDATTKPDFSDYPGCKSLFEIYAKNSNSTNRYRLAIMCADTSEEAIDNLKMCKFHTYTLYYPSSFYPVISPEITIDVIISVVDLFIQRFDEIMPLKIFFRKERQFHYSCIDMFINKLSHYTPYVFGLMMDLRFPKIGDFRGNFHACVIDQWISCEDNLENFANHIYLHHRNKSNHSKILYGTPVSWIVGDKRVQASLAAKKRRLHRELVAAAAIRGATRKN